MPAATVVILRRSSPSKGIHMPDTRFDVVGIGSAIVDILANADDAFIAGQKMHKGSMVLVDEVQADRLYNTIGPTTEMSGGSAANTMAGIASFGGRPAFIGKVRNDNLGQVFTQDIRASGVHYVTAAETAGPSTARCIVLVSDDAERTMSTYLGASTSLSAADMDPALITKSKVTYVEGYQWDLPQTKMAILGACKAACDAGGKIALSLSDAFCVDRHRGDLLELTYDHVDILFANETEIISLLDTNTFVGAVDAIRGLCEVAVLTRGADGAVLVTGDETIEIPVEPITKIKDTTGAGDLFASGFLFGYTHNRSIETCGRLGALAAAEVIGHMGARPLTPLKELLNGNGK